MTRSPKFQPAAIAENAPANPASCFKAGTKQAAVVDMLNREIGASQAELTAATGWLPHTVRAALTGLRKRGLNITYVKIDGVTRYTIAAA